VPLTICATAVSRARRCWCPERLFGILLWALALPLWAAANDVEEARLTAGLLEGAPVGRVLQLQRDGGSFPALFEEARPARRKGLVILLPEAGLRLDAGLAGRLRRVIPEYGWSTLSLQLPVLEPEAHPDEYWALVPEAVARLKFAIAAMQGEGWRNIALVGHGFGAAVALNYLGHDPDPAVRAVVLLSPWWPMERAARLRDWLTAVKVPVLDVYGESDAREIRRTVRERHSILKGRKGYRQWRISGVGHHYRDREAALAKRIYGWLERVAPGIEVTSDE